MHRVVVSALPVSSRRAGARLPLRLARLARGSPLLWPILWALKSSEAWAYPGQGVVEGSQVLFGTLAVMALIGTVFASIFNRQYVREALYSLVATFTLFALVRWAPQLVSLVKQ
jgi:hypothetical protein